MRQIIKAAAFIAALLPGLAAAQVPQFPQNLPGNSVVGRLGTQPGPSQAIPFSILVTQMKQFGGFVAGPTTSVMGDFAVWSSNVGTSLSDGGTPGTLAFVNGGTGVNTALAASLNATGGLVGYSGQLGTPTQAVLTNATGLPISTGVSGLGTGCATFLGTPSSANLRGCLTDETGTGTAYFVGGALGTPASGTATNITGLPISTGVSGLGTGIATALGVNVGTAGAPVVNGGALGTPTAGVATNLTGTAAGLTAGNVTTNANLTGDVTSVGNATTLTNAPVIAKVLTGFTSGAGTVTAADSILSAIQKVYGNNALNLPLTGGTMSGNIAMGGNAITGGGAITGTTITGTSYVGLPSATNAVKGIMEGDGSTISCVAGVCSSVGSAAAAVTLGTTTATGGTAGDVVSITSTGCSGTTPCLTQIAAGTLGQTLASGGGTNQPTFKSGAWTLLNTVTASGSAATLSDTTSITSSYTEYEIVLENIVPATTSNTLVFQFQIGGSFQATSYLATTMNGSGATVSSETNTSGVQLNRLTALANTGAGASGLSGRYLLSNPLSSQICHYIYGNSAYSNGSSSQTTQSSGCFDNGAGTTINGIQVTPVLGGNINAGGVMKIYGRL